MVPYPPVLDRRSFLLSAAPALALLQAGCAAPRAGTAIREINLVAAPAQVHVRGAAQPAVNAWAYGGGVPGPQIRARQGERLRVVLDNLLPQATTVHWAHAGRIGNVVNVNGVVAPEIALRAGERLRLRLLNAANARIFALQFDGHRPQVIALDGQPVAAHEPARDRVVLAPGMRCDLQLEAVGAPGQRFAVGDVFSARAAYDLLHLVYGPEPLRAQPLSAPVSLPSNPLAEPEVAAAQVHEIRFEGGMMGGLHRALLDGRPTDMMSLLRAGKAWALNGVVANDHHLAPMLTLARGGSHVFRMRNDTRWFHPIHLHGHAFRVLARNGQPAPRREWQDTVLMAPQEQVDIAFVADNPGDWMLHCHVLEHQEGGMMGVVRVASSP